MLLLLLSTALCSGAYGVEYALSQVERSGVIGRRRPDGNSRCECDFIFFDMLLSFVNPDCPILSLIVHTVCVRIGYFDPSRVNGGMRMELLFLFPRSCLRAPIPDSPPPLPLLSQVQVLPIPDSSPNVNHNITYQGISLRNSCLAFDLFMIVLS